MQTSSAAAFRSLNRGRLDFPRSDKPFNGVPQDLHKRCGFGDGQPILRRARVLAFEYRQVFLDPLEDSRDVRDLGIVLGADNLHASSIA